MDRGIEARNLREAIVALPEPYREVVILCGIDNKTYEEAAAIRHDDLRIVGDQPVDPWRMLFTAPTNCTDAQTPLPRH